MGKGTGLVRKIMGRSGVVPVVSKPRTGVGGLGELAVPDEDGSGVLETISEDIVITMDKKNREWRWWVTTSGRGEHPGGWIGIPRWCAEEDDPKRGSEAGN